MSNNKHMNLETRATIQHELDKGSSFKSIGTLLEKDCTTISKEVRKHIFGGTKGSLMGGQYKAQIFDALEFFAKRKGCTIQSSDRRMWTGRRIIFRSSM